VAGRTADHQTREGLSAAVAITSGPFRKFAEVGLPLLHISVAAFLGLFAHVIEKRGVARELLNAGEAVIGRVEARLQHAQGERAELEHPAAPCDRLLLERRQRHDLVDEAHLEGLLGVVLLTEKPDLASLLLADDAGKEAGAVAAVEAAN